MPLLEPALPLVVFDRGGLVAAAVGGAADDAAVGGGWVAAGVVHHDGVSGRVRHVRH